MIIQLKSFCIKQDLMTLPIWLFFPAGLFATTILQKGGQRKERQKIYSKKEINTKFV